METFTRFGLTADEYETAQRMAAAGQAEISERRWAETRGIYDHAHRAAACARLRRIESAVAELIAREDVRAAGY